jgi:hypothetical protein
LLNYIESKFGILISTTTDGLIPNFVGLEDPSLKIRDFSEIIKTARFNFSDNETFLEVKHIDKEGVIS